MSKKNIFYVNKAHSHHYVHTNAVGALWDPTNQQYSSYSRQYIALLISVNMVP